MVDGFFDFKKESEVLRLQMSFCCAFFASGCSPSRDSFNEAASENDLSSTSKSKRQSPLKDSCRFLIGGTRHAKFFMMMACCKVTKFSYSPFREPCGSHPTDVQQLGLSVHLDGLWHGWFG